MAESKGKIFRVSDISANSLKQRREIYVKGFDCGFKTGDEFVSYRVGYSTGIYSYSAQGKTQYYIQEAVHLSKAHGWKHAIWLTENGRKEELIMDIAMTVMGKSLFSDQHDISDEEIIEAFAWMDDHFWIIDHEEHILTIRDIFSTVAEYEKAMPPLPDGSPFKFQSVAIDNASNLGRGVDTQRMSTSEYMNHLMTAVNRTSLTKRWHTFILFHVNITDQIECPTTGLKYMPCPNHYMISGGQQINYLGYQLICIWRPISRQEQVGIIDPETGCPFELNETQVVVTKTKPKAVGSQGRFRIYFDTHCQRYYEWFEGTKYYVGEYFAQNGGGTVQEDVPLQKQLTLDQESIFESAIKANVNF